MILSYTFTNGKYKYHVSNNVSKNKLTYTLWLFLIIPSKADVLYKNKIS